MTDNDLPEFTKRHLGVSSWRAWVAMLVALVGMFVASPVLFACWVIWVAGCVVWEARRG